MLKQTIIWTALPNGSDGSLQAGTQLRLSAYVSPRLWSDTPNIKEKLQSYPDFLDWPATVKQATFEVEFGDGTVRDATPDFTPLRSDLWQALFNKDTLVIPYVFEDYSSETFQGDQLADAHQALKAVYQDVATDPVYGQGKVLPKAVDLARHSILQAIGRPYVPARPYEPPPAEPVVIPGEPPPEPLPPPESMPRGCLPTLVRLLRWLFHLIGLLFLLPFAAVSTGQAKSATSGLVAFLKPFHDEPQPMPNAQEINEAYDFHSGVSSLGDYPLLLRALGLVIDLTVTLDTPLPPTTSTIRIVPSLAMEMISNLVSMRTHYELGDSHFLAKPRPAGPEVSNGLLRLNDDSKFQVVQVDATGGVVKLVNLASNLPVQGDSNLKPENMSEEAGLPALRSGGIALVKPHLAEDVYQQSLKAYAYNKYVAAIDGSPTPPSSSPTPPPAPTDELFAEDLVRGYRIDVFDDRSNRWHSLCQRMGTYDFGGGLVLLDQYDEGFVTLGATKPMDKNTSNADAIHVGETLITWDGWSLCTPRPGKTILDEYTDASKTDYKTGYPANPVATSFSLSTNFREAPGTLPRLRFGYQYNLRARAVDLAGNSVFEPGDDAFQEDVTEKTPSQTYHRFDPVSPPPLALRTEPIEGESLERLVVRSTIHEDAKTIHGRTTERHIVPPKTSQLMAEQHGHFDGVQKMRSDPAAYQLASREAGRLFERLNSTGQLEKVSGVKIAGDHWLQSNEQFELTYLPDPYARGVLLLGLPGMATFDQVIEPDSGAIVNKIPFEGKWPDLKALRIRLKGLKDGETPVQPQWDASARLLTVELPQGEMAQVQISAYFHEEDLRNMGVWQWTEETGVPDLHDLRSLAVEGRNWLYLPFRTLTLVHAVQQPLAIPQISTLNIVPPKKLGETSVDLKGTVTVDGKSTGKLDLLARWSDPRDDPSDPANNPVTDMVRQEMHVAEINLIEGSGDQVDLPKDLHHVLGDTKYHRVTYQMMGTTRFREYFPLPANVTDLIRPTPSESGSQAVLGAMKPVDILNSARPVAPKPLYVVPNFPWSEVSSGDVISHMREGGWLRVYLERPWFSSGDGELLGVIIRPEEVSPDSKLAEALKPYTSQWGMDPIWESSHLEPLRLEHLFDPVEIDHNLSLEEVPRKNASDNRAVHVAAYRPEYDSVRQLWYCDLSFDPALFTSYFPFVRLALARYQLNSVFSDDELNSAHLSRVVLADFVQLVPTRQVDYDTSQIQANQTIQITVRGPSARKYEQTPQMAVTFEERDPNVPIQEDELGWTQIGKPVLLPTQPGQPLENMIWTNTLTLPSPQPKPLRVVVREVEAHAADWNAAVILPEERNQPPTIAKLPRSRLVFADALVLKS